jgi:hypothetical protein
VAGCEEPLGPGADRGHVTTVWLVPGTGP